MRKGVDFAVGQLEADQFDTIASGDSEPEHGDGVSWEALCENRGFLPLRC